MNKQNYFTPHQALVKIQKFCAYQERCQQQVREKLREWKLKEQETENIIVQLISENFLNEERFAKAYARGKFRIKKWGRIKIKMALQQLDISSYCIKQAMKEIDDNEYRITLEQVVKKSCTGKISNLSLPQKFALVKKIITKGYEQDLIWEAIKSHKSA